MAVAIPRVITETSASGGVPIDGCIRFEKTKEQYLTRTPSSEGNRFCWTWSVWVQRDNLAYLPAGGGSSDVNHNPVFCAGTSSSASTDFRYGKDSGDDGDKFWNINWDGGSTYFSLEPYARYRDTNAFYHIVSTYDSVKARVYINGFEIGEDTPEIPWETNTQNGGTSKINSTEVHSLGSFGQGTVAWFGGNMSQFYLIDGKQLQPTDFGYTDPLTNMWRPKKYPAYTSLNKNVLWSGLVTGSFQSSGYNATKAFDGNLTGSWSIAADSTSVTFTPINPIVARHSIRVKLEKNGSGGPLSQNGTDLTSSVATGWLTLPSNTLTSLVWGSGTSGNQCQMMGIQVDGEILIDSENDTTNYGTNGCHLPLDGTTPLGQDQSGGGNDYFPMNFGGWTNVDDATGGLPLANTIAGGKIQTPGARGQVSIGVSIFGPGEGVFYFDGVANPTLDVYRGQTIKFDLSHTSNGSHPLKFSSTADGTHGSGTEWTAGCQYGAISEGNPGAGTTITFPEDTPDNFYYYCENHMDMGGALTLRTNATKADPSASKNVLALTLDGYAEDVSTSVACTSVTKTVAVGQGDPSASTAQHHFYEQSYHFDGSSDALTVSSNDDFGFGTTTPFTCECWIYPTALPGAASASYIWHFVGSDDVIGYNNDGTFNVQLGGSYSPTNYSQRITVDRWQHFAVTSDGTDTRAYLDGQLAMVDSSTRGNMGTANEVEIGNHATLGRECTAYISDVKIYKGHKKYVEDFIPAAPSPTILSVAPSSVYYGGKPSTYSSGSVAFYTGSGGSLTSGTSSDYTFGTGDFTVECWIFMTAAQTQGMFDTDTSNTTGRYCFAVYFSGSLGKLVVDTLGSSPADAGSYTMTTGRWYHCVSCRSGSTHKLFLDGKEVFSGSDTTDYTKTNGIIGDMAAGGSYFSGLISNLRVVKGTCVYNRGFTPPGSPLTTNSPLMDGGFLDPSDVSLLCCNDGADAQGYTVAASAITASGATPSKNNPFYNFQEPAETRYATLDPLSLTSSKLILSEGNLRVAQDGSDYALAASTMSVNSGKWYCEVELIAARFGFGIWEVNKCSIDTWIGQTAYDWGWKWDGSSSAFRHDTAGAGTAYASATSAGDVIALSLDLSGTPGTNTGVLTYYKNGVSQGAAASNIPIAVDKFYGILLGDDTSSQDGDARINFGQNPFKYAIPAGHKPLAQISYDLPAVPNPSNVVGIVTYLGTGSSDNVISDLGFKPDLVCIKQRNTSRSWGIFDTTRGVNQAIRFDGDVAEYTTSGGLEEFRRDGFEVGDNTVVGESGGGYVGYGFKAGGNLNTYNIDGVGHATGAAAGLADGTITPLGASINTRSGFSILKYTGNGNSGATMNHGLNEAPTFVVIKNLAIASDWEVYHSAMGNTHALQLNQDYAKATGSTYWNDTSPTSSLLTLGDASQLNGSTNNLIAYCWHNVEGLQRFGSYLGNGSADGVLVQCGFRPDLVIIKGHTHVSNWNIIDCVRSPYNVASNLVRCNLDGGEGSTATGTYGIAWDFVSNGFKLRAGSGTNDCNQTGETYIYMAWAKNPYRNSYGAQAIAF